MNTLFLTLLGLIYLSFLMDFLVFPIPSEVSTKRLNGSDNKRSMLPVWLAHAIVLCCWAYPLVFALGSSDVTPSPVWLWSGLCLATLGRLVTWAASRQLRQSPDGLLTHGAFAHTRHPIVCGLHLTLAGMLLTTAQPIAFVLLLFNLLYFDFKLDLEEQILQTTLPGYEAYGVRCSRYPAGFNGFHWQR